ncbi:Synaptotagmin-9 [Taenia solium]|eukprot:TsM_000076400 transcript=TsM_000076400 gene=TsM_000076400
MNFNSLKLSNAKAEHDSQTDLSHYPLGTLIPQEVLQKRIAEHESEQSFEALRRKVEKADEEWRRKQEIERLIADRRGRLQDHGVDHQLGVVTFLLVYDINSETLRVTLLGANHLRPRDPLEVVVNVRVSVTVERCGSNKKAILPRPKLSMLNRLASNQNATQHLNGGQRTTGKTYTTDASSSSIYWRTRKPMWNENFFFDGLQNRLLKRLEVVFRVFERYPTKPPEAPREDLIGEARIPLVKLHKKLADNGVKMVVPEKPLRRLKVTGAQEAGGNADQQDGEENERKEAEEEAEEEEEVKQRVEIELPKEKPLGEKEAVTRWLEGTISPIPGQDAEMEELQSICNSEAVREELQDPELMDSVSVREMRLANAEVKTHLDTIKELATAPSTLKPEETEQSSNLQNECDDSEPELPQSERPFIIRRLEGWHFINRVPEMRPCYGTLEIGLKFDPNLGKIVISIIKGKEMYAPDGSLMQVWVSVQQKTRICKKSSPFSAMESMRLGSKSNASRKEPVAITEKAGKLFRTSVRSETAEPVWDDRFAFNVPKEQLEIVSFDILVHNQGGIIGGLKMGHSGMHVASQHWANMMQHPGVWITSKYMVQ